MAIFQSKVFKVFFVAVAMLNLNILEKFITYEFSTKEMFFFIFVSLIFLPVHVKYETFI